MQTPGILSINSEGGGEVEGPDGTTLQGPTRVPAGGAIDVSFTVTNLGTAATPTATASARPSRSRSAEPGGTASSTA